MESLVEIHLDSVDWGKFCRFEPEYLNRLCRILLRQSCTTSLPFIPKWGGGGICRNFCPGLIGTISVGKIQIDEYMRWGGRGLQIFFEKLLILLLKENFEGINKCKPFWLSVWTACRCMMSWYSPNTMLMSSSTTHPVTYDGSSSFNCEKTKKNWNYWWWKNFAKTQKRSNSFF